MLKDKKKGFSLIGVIVALFIILIGITGVISLATLSLKSSTTSKMRLIASGLAQEGLEIVRNIRRSNINWDDWYNSISNGDYLVEYDRQSLIPFVSEEGSRLNINAQGYYEHDPGTATPFYRKITFTKISANELKLIIEVKWQVRDNWSNLTVENYLNNWK